MSQANLILGPSPSASVITNITGDATSGTICMPSPGKQKNALMNYRLTQFVSVRRYN